MPKNRRRLVLIGLGTAAFVVVLDQLTKYLARSNLKGNPIHLVGFLGLRLTFNTGVAFGLLTGHPLVVTFIDVVLAALIGGGVLLTSGRLGSAIFSGMIIGGAAGNLIDRFASGKVTDFIYTGFWPTFNLADASVVIGVAGLILMQLTEEVGRARKGVRGAPGSGGNAPGPGGRHDERSDEGRLRAPHT